MAIKVFKIATMQQMPGYYGYAPTDDHILINTDFIAAVYLVDPADLGIKNGAPVTEHLGKISVVRMSNDRQYAVVAPLTDFLCD